MSPPPPLSLPPLAGPPCRSLASAFHLGHLGLVLGTYIESIHILANTKKKEGEKGPLEHMKTGRGIFTQANAVGNLLGEAATFVKLSFLPSSRAQYIESSTPFGDGCSDKEHRNVRLFCGCFGNAPCAGFLRACLRNARSPGRANRPRNQAVGCHSGTTTSTDSSHLNMQARSQKH